ncbi:MAG: hypothetical protein IPL79_12530 [Myxococcales bacterium]|nr:hypothetical protein [Myxococcales bacterium]
MHVRLVVAGSLAITTLSGLIALERAEACSPPLECPQMRYPLDGATGVPTNTKLWTRYNGTLSLSYGKATPIDLAMAPITTLPEALLPNTIYTVTLTADPEISFGCDEPTVLSFTTGSGPDAAPVPPAINEVTSTYYPYDDTNSCGPTEERFIVEVSVSPPLVADAVAYRLYQVEHGDRVGTGTDTMLPAMPLFYVNGTSVDNDYEMVAVSASGLESSASAFDVIANTPYRDGSGLGVCSAHGEQANANNFASMLLVVLCAIGATRRKSQPPHQQQ